MLYPHMIHRLTQRRQTMMRYTVITDITRDEHGPALELIVGIDWQ